jgi:hypothetical protein
MTVNSSDISNNRASNGGGASANGELHINSSTVHDNTATTTGGGVFRYLGTITLPGTDVTANTPNNCAAFTGTPDC